MGISLLYVVRNEEQLLAKSIASAEPLADQIVVVDTGSADETVRAARNASRKVKVVSYPWCHDFSKARNHGLQHCTGDWVMYLDADEVIDHKTVELVKESVKSAKTNVWGFSIRIIDLPGGFGSEPMEPFFRSPQTRIFRRRPEIRFERAVMEWVDPSITAARAGIDLIPGAVQHWIWRGKGPEFAAMKVKYYRKLGATMSEPTDVSTPSSNRELLAPPVPSPELAIIVVGYDAVNFTKQCVGSLRSLTVPYRLIMVDNGSSDETSGFIQEMAGENAIFFRRNEGLAKARNEAMTRIMRDPSIRNVLFLDNDCMASKGSVEEMLGILRSDELLAAVGPISNAASGAQSYGRSEKPSMDEVIPEIAGRNPDRVEVSGLSNFCMLFKAEALRRVGFFDESLGGHEAEDMCARICSIGLKMAVANRAYVFHRGRTTMMAHPNINWNAKMQVALSKYRTKWNIESDDHKARRMMIEQAKASLPSYMVKAPTHMAPTRAIPMKATRPQPMTDIVILTHNRLDMTKPCIESILRHTTNYKIIVVDNGSTDGTVDYLTPIPGVKVLRNDKNIGIPRARNQGLRATTSPYVILMDNDIEVKSGWLDDLFSEIKKGAHAVGIEGWRLDKSWSACAKCNSPSEHFDYLGGACTLFDRRLFEVAGILDEGYSPAYYEDVEMSIRAKENGFRLAFNPTPAIVHKQHATLIYGQKTFSYHAALGASYDRFARRMRGELKVEYEKLPPANRKLKILYLGMTFDYGIRERGTSFEHDNFFPALRQWDRTGELRHFDFLEMGKAHGVPGMSERLVKEAQDFQPDAVFAVFFNEASDPRYDAMTALKNVCPAATIGWFCDSHFRYENFDSKWAPYLDFCVTTSSGAYQKYVRDGHGGKVIKSQWFASPAYRKIDGVQKDIPVSFIGQPHGDRRTVIDKIRATGINVETYGTGWGKRLSFDEMIMTFNRTKINLNLNNAADARYQQIKGRNFEVPACGGFLLTGSPENLEDYYAPGVEVSVFSDGTDLIEKIRYYLKNESERERIAAAGYERTMREHTSKHRLDAIFSSAGLIRS